MRKVRKVYILCHAHAFCPECPVLVFLLKDVPHPICRLLLNSNDEVDSTDLGSTNYILITLQVTAAKPIAGSLNCTSAMFRVEVCPSL